MKLLDDIINKAADDYYEKISLFKKFPTTDRDLIISDIKAAFREGINFCLFPENINMKLIITEDNYVSFEVAKLLVKKGFDWNTEKSYVIDTADISGRNIGDRLNVTNYDSCLIPCPTQSLAMKWLRETHKLHIYVFHSIPCESIMNWSEWVFEIDKIDEDWTYSLHRGNTYEESVEEAIKYALNNFV